MNKYLPRHIVVLDHVELAIEMMDKIHVQDLDMLSGYGQDDLRLLVFVAEHSPFNWSLCIVFSIEYKNTSI